MPELTVERLFDNPPLTGTLPSQFRYAPDGSCIVYLQTAPDDRERLDLWRMDLPGGECRCWVNSAAMLTDTGVLSDAEKAERERKRLFSRGITTFEISPDGNRLLIPVEGRGYFWDVQTEKLMEFTPSGSRQTDFRFSPAGRFVSYVRNGDLHVYDIDRQLEQAVTTDGGGTIANGIADFIAQEEMHRYEGHWWSPDESAIAFTRTDESTVEVSRRYEIDADQFNVIEQRYPYAGADNAAVELFVYRLMDRERLPVDYRHEAEDYLARVAWAGTRLAVQVQSRDQHDLYLDFHQPGHPGRQTIIHESSETWINLHDNFRFIGGDRFLWTSERDGASQLYLYDGSQPIQLTRGPGRVDEIVHADETQVYYCGWRDSPAERHLFRLPMPGNPPVETGGRLLPDGSATQITTEPGWHEIEMSRDGRSYVDRFSSLGNMGRVQVRSTHESAGHELAVRDDRASHPYDDYLHEHLTPRIGQLTADDGQLLYYRLTEPRHGRNRHPLIVFVYGGPGVHRVKNEWAPLLLQLFAQRGFGVLELDNRGSSNRERAFEAPIYRRLGRVEVEDQLAGVRFARTLDWVDGDRIGVFGHSYGGYMTVMCMTQAPDTFKAGVAVAPVSDWSLYDTHYTERYLSTPRDNPAGYRDSAVFPYLDNLKGRLLIMHGMADDNVLFTHSTKLFKALQSKRKPFEMMTYPGSKHALQEQDVSIHRFNMILEFFERQLSHGPQERA